MRISYTLRFGPEFKDFLAKIKQIGPKLKYSSGKRKQKEDEIQEMDLKKSDGKKWNIAVINFEPQESISLADAAFATEFLRGGLVRSDAFHIVEKQNMDRILVEQGFQQTGCTTQECAIKIGNILNVERMIFGMVGKLVDQYMILINIADVETGKIIYYDKEECSSPGGFENAVNRLVKKLVNIMGN